MTETGHWNNAKTGIFRTSSHQTQAPFFSLIQLLCRHLAGGARGSPAHLLPLPELWDEARIEPGRLGFTHQRRTLGVPLGPLAWHWNYSSQMIKENCTNSSEKWPLQKAQPASPVLPSAYCENGDLQLLDRHQPNTESQHWPEGGGRGKR